MAKEMTPEDRKRYNEARDGLQESVNKVFDMAPKASCGVIGGLLLAGVPVVGTALAIGAMATGVGLEIRDKIKGK
ncbi:hypothetical protein [Helicobacter cynogastricus]|uniref:hypothetical protein n=1 Tax=Helicobacter cynogastricus TaxID=329937 RepID=UPI000CF0CBBD|nr:hypothetical protein [Helicobacter cynogastricus]